MAALVETGVLGRWTMDECSAGSTVLVDASGAGADAQRTGSVACAEGFVGQAVRFDESGDRIESAGMGFQAREQVTLATSVKADSTREGTLVAKAVGRRTPFSLALVRNNVVFSVELSGRRRTVTSSQPLPTGAWSHVVGSYDGQSLRLFVNGQQVGEVAATGTIPDAAGSVRMGEGFRGELDDVLVASVALGPREAFGPTCVMKPATLHAMPNRKQLLGQWTLARFALRLSNNNRGPCETSTFTPVTDPAPDFMENSPQVISNFEPRSAELGPGQSLTFVMTVHSLDTSVAGTHTIKVGMMVEGDARAPAEAVTEVLLNRPPADCVVQHEHELFIRDVSVVDDPMRSVYDRNSSDPRAGAWTFGRLMEQLAPEPEEAPRMVENLFRSWLRDRTVNTFNVAARPAMRELVLSGWPRVDGELDLSRAPLRLLAITNRLDLRDLARGHAGAGHFVFGLLDSSGNPLNFTLTLEYRFPARTEADVLDWASRWHALSALSMPSEEFNAALQAITDRFAGRGVEPGQPNGSAFTRLRTNDLALHPDQEPEMREFGLSSNGRSLQPAPLERSPDTNFFLEGAPLISAFVNQNESTILVNEHSVPRTFQGTPFLAGSATVHNFPMLAPGINNIEVRHQFAFNTCYGCHSVAETGTRVMMVFPREHGQQSEISRFMVGVLVRNPVSGLRRGYSDLDSRAEDVASLVCGTTPVGSLSKGSGRVH